MTCRLAGTSTVPRQLDVDAERTKCLALTTAFVLLRSRDVNERGWFDVDEGTRLRPVLWRLRLAGYSERSVLARLGLRDLCDLRIRAAPMYRAERLMARDPLDVAIDVFLLERAVSSHELARLFGDEDVALLVRAGVLMLEPSGDARARASLFPVDGHLVFSDHAAPDLFDDDCAEAPADQVMFVGADSRWLARATVRRAVDASLDLCTGSGVQALLASGHSRRVVATDLNPRAVRCARFNAAAAGVTNLDVLIGDLYAPVRGQRFDLITANPPFVPSPVDSLAFRDGGPSGEDVVKRVVAGVPEHLAPGGVAQVVTELGERDGEPLVDRLRAWVGGAPLDIHVLRLRAHSAADYAMGHARGATAGALLDSADAWAGNLRAQGYSRVVAILAGFRWSDASVGDPWNRVDDSAPPSRAAGAEIEDRFAAQRRMCDPRIGPGGQRVTLRRADPIAVQHARVLGYDVPTSTTATRLGRALAVEHPIVPLEAALLERLTGDVDLAQLLALARGSELSEESVLDAIRSLVGRGLVTFADDTLPRASESCECNV